MTFRLVPGPLGGRPVEGPVRAAEMGPDDGQHDEPDGEAGEEPQCPGPGGVVAPDEEERPEGVAEGEERPGVHEGDQKLRCLGPPLANPPVVNGEGLDADDRREREEGRGEDEARAAGPAEPAAGPPPLPLPETD